MNILVVPDSFKGGLTAEEFCKITKSVFAEEKVVFVPFSDGGEGFLKSLEIGGDIELIPIKTLNSSGANIESFVGVKGKVGYIELAQASGYQNREVPILHRSTYGTGEQIRFLIDNFQLEEIVIGLGGSSTNDLGLGIAEALGVCFYDANGNKVNNVVPSKWPQITKIDLSSLIQTPQIVVATDVKNFLHGTHGAANVYGPQKGATVDEVQYLETESKNISTIITDILGINVANKEGSGAAGGVLCGLCLLKNIKIVSGAEFLFELTNIDDKIKFTDLVISGEGKLDNQSLNGKVVERLAQLCKKYRKSFYVFVGQCLLNAEDLQALGVSSVIEINDSKKSLEENIAQGPELLNIKLNEFRNYMTNSI